MFPPILKVRVVVVLLALASLSACASHGAEGLKEEPVAEPTVEPTFSETVQQDGREDMEFTGLAKVKEEYSAYWDTLSWPTWHKKRGVPSWYEEDDMFRDAEYGEGYGKSIVGDEYGCVWEKEYLQAHVDGDSERENAALDKLYAQLEMEHFQWPLADESLSQVLKNSYQKARLGDSSEFQVDFDANCSDYF